MMARRELSDRNLSLERLSALIDGELDADEAAALLGELCRDRQLARLWSDLHLVGDAMRSTEVAGCHAEGFCARVARALSSEPTVLAPRRSQPGLHRFVAPGVAIAASIAAVGFIAMPLLRTQEPPLIATAPPASSNVSTVTAEPVPAPSAPQAAEKTAPRVPPAIANVRELDPYFAAHRELISASALPRATVYLRTSGEER
jgi:sigma-E factor negative regulatory protein RseA